jgi:hypothetical protein
MNRTFHGWDGTERVGNLEKYEIIWADNGSQNEQIYRRFLHILDDFSAACASSTFTWVILAHILVGKVLQAKQLYHTVRYGNALHSASIRG